MISTEFIILIVAVLLLLWWVIVKNKSTDQTYYDVVQDMVDARLGKDSSDIINRYLDPEGCSLKGNLPSLNYLETLKVGNPGLFQLYANNGTVKRAVNLKTLKEWIKLGKKENLYKTMELVNNINLERQNLKALEKTLQNMF
ncbi:hypothetical protein IIV31_145L [Armadillidium vulgare iridescent virus]|uniref:Uncharacterized protein n=1 Tax=Armadillidium vulgare iridescent virus TaxID=72201 RepID=A0A068QKF9_9VIRU|nr:hypothetical protein IIV31_145L [Armadillidium vulgare iridescent virus]CCV02517.1 hypothetical protein IIV31_145L [Armadillidium vulgare iridescent virus]